MLGSTHLCCWPWVGLGWQVRKGSHGLLGPNPPMSFPSSFREWAPLPCPPEPPSLRQLLLWLYFRNIRSGKASACTVTDYRFSSLLVRKRFPLPFHAWRPGIWCSIFQLTFVLPLSCLSVVRQVPCLHLSLGLPRAQPGPTGVFLVAPV